MASSYTPVVRVQLVKESSIRGRKALSSSNDAKDIARRYFTERGSDRECFVVAHLDTKLRPLSIELVTQGTLDASLVHAREVFKAAIVAGARSILVMHNHPSGDPTPSSADFDVTRKLIKAGEVIGIDVLDHIVVGDDPDAECVSMREDHRHEAGF
ncbi:MAG: DNA repair protein RadC [Porticoccaceae bacterium]|nr:DNA repair protein RadC [Porticoccaceae bacterium]